MSLPGPRICGWECILADRFCPHGAKIANAKYCDLVCIDPGGLMRGGNVAVLALHFCATSRAKDWEKWMGTIMDAKYTSSPCRAHISEQPPT